MSFLSKFDIDYSPPKEPSVKTIKEAINLIDTYFNECINQDDIDAKFKEILKKMVSS